MANQSNIEQQFPQPDDAREALKQLKDLDSKPGDNKYPRILLESSLKIDRFFSEKANQKK